MSSARQGPVIRPATPDDAAGCREVYAPYVRETTVTFETEVPDVEEFAGRISRALEHHDWLVAELDGRVLGYAYAGRLLPTQGGQGGGRRRAGPPMLARQP